MTQNTKGTGMKHTENEPVACDCSNVVNDCSEKEGCCMLAKLNTHPAKTLTDEEILKLEEIEFDNYCVDKESKGRKTATITDPEWAIWFARAILKKASEK